MHCYYTVGARSLVHIDSKLTMYWTRLHGHILYMDLPPVVKVEESIQPCITNIIIILIE